MEKLKHDHDTTSQVYWLVEKLNEVIEVLNKEKGSAVVCWGYCHKAKNGEVVICACPCCPK